MTEAIIMEDAQSNIFPCGEFKIVITYQSMKEVLLPEIWHSVQVLPMFPFSQVVELTLHLFIKLVNIIFTSALLEFPMITPFAIFLHLRGSLSFLYAELLFARRWTAS